MSETRNKARKTPNAVRSTLLGIELPFDWCLVRGRELRALQIKLRAANQTAEIRLRSYAHLLRENIRKESK